MNLQRRSLLAGGAGVAAALAAPAVASAWTFGDSSYKAWEVLQGTATHVGSAYYPWEDVIAFRKRLGQVSAPWQIERREHLSALHESMYTARYFGKRAWVLSLETGRVLWVDIVDAMASGRGHPDPSRHDRVIDLTPQLFGWLLGRPDGPGRRGGQDVVVLLPQDGVPEPEWPTYPE